MAQPTSFGRRIARLTPFAGKIYPLSYGDLDTNTGPLDVVALDVTAQTIGAVEATLNTEQFCTVRVIGGKIYAPYADPRGTNSDPTQGQYAVCGAPGSWTVVTSVTGVTHAFDVAETVDGLWVCGSRDDVAVVWRSTDDGATWGEALTVTTGPDGARFYAFAQFGGDLIAFYFDDVTTTALAYMWTAGGTEWTLLDPYPLVVAAAPVRITDTLAQFTYQGADIWIGVSTTKDTSLSGANIPRIIVHPDSGLDPSAILATFPARVRDIPADAGADAQLFDARIDGGALWVLTGNHEVWRADAAGTWQLVTAVNTTAISLAVVDGWIYLGTSNGRILRVAVPT